MRILSRLLLISCLLAGVILVSAEETKSADDKDLIHVSGTGTVKASPDTAKISFSVVTQNPDVKIAQTENAKKMDSVMKALTDPDSGNLTNEEISTSSYSISRVYYPDDALKAKFGPNTTLYEVSNKISIETKKTDQVGEIIDLAVAKGANDVSELDFTLGKDETETYRVRALQIAADKARKDAETVLTSIGRSMGNAHEISVDESSSPPVYYNQRYLSDKAAVAGAPSTPIEPGEVEVTARVTITYQIA